MATHFSWSPKSVMRGISFQHNFPLKIRSFQMKAQPLCIFITLKAYSGKISMNLCASKLKKYFPQVLLNLDFSTASAEASKGVQSHPKSSCSTLSSILETHFPKAFVSNLISVTSILLILSLVWGPQSQMLLLREASLFTLSKQTPFLFPMFYLIAPITAYNYCLPFIVSLLLWTLSCRRTCLSEHCLPSASHTAQQSKCSVSIS